MLCVIMMVCFRMLRSAKQVGCGCGAARRVDPLSFLIPLLCSSVGLDLKLVEWVLGDPPSVTL